MTAARKTLGSSPSAKMHAAPDCAGTGIDPRRIFAVGHARLQAQLVGVHIGLIGRPRAPVFIPARARRGGIR